MAVAWPANGVTDWNTKMLTYLAVEHKTNGTHKDLTADSLMVKDPWFDVRHPDFGAIGDGVTDDATAFQVAIDAIKTVGGGTLCIPTGVYKIGTSLDCTGFLGASGIAYKSLHIKGASINSSRILGATSGKPIFDFTASGYCSMENLRITGHSSDTPNVAILLARNSVAGSAGIHNFRRIFVEGEFTKGGIYCFASEVNTFDDVHVTMTGSGGGTWCMAFTESNFESITSDYETILATTAPMTRTTLIGGRLNMHDTPGTGTCLYLYDSVGDLTWYGAYMYSADQSHIKMYSTEAADTLYRINFHNLRCEGKAATTKPDYGIWMTGAADGAFSEILVENSYIDAYIYEIYQDNTVTGTFSGKIDKVRTVHGLELKFNKVTHSVINVLTGDLTVDTSITQSEVVNYHTGTISLAGEDAVTERNFTTRSYRTALLKKSSDIRTLADEATPSVIIGNLFKTGGTANDPITDFNDGVTGQPITIFAEHSVVIDVDAGNIFLDGAVDFNMDDGDTLSLVCKADNKWYETGRSDNT